MSKLMEILLSNMKEYKNKDVVIAKDILENNKKLTFVPVDFEIFYDKKNDKIVFIEKSNSYSFD